MKNEWKVFLLVLGAYIVISIVEGYWWDMSALGHVDWITFAAGLVTGVVLGSFFGSIALFAVKVGIDPAVSVVTAIILPLILPFLIFYRVLKKKGRW